ncbi:MAG TPA: type II secretion system major pseudopilin GspG [Thermoguttaceae bacterium]|nr:type II secretion system major pseudopilin GspG [Thermoguttaceae bacterium]
MSLSCDVVRRPVGPGRRDRRALTLIEVLLVLAILVMIASMAVVAYGPIQQKANIQSAKTQLGNFDTALGLYHLDMGSYPTTQQGLDALRNPPGDLPNPAKWNGPYLKTEVPLDPWSRPYQYECPGRYNPDSYDVWSLGPDGQNGTNDDIGNWTVQ